MIYLRKFLLVDLRQHIRWHLPQAVYSTDRDILDSDLSDYTSDIATVFGAGEIDIVADTQATLGLLC
jgi:hypothetical protein